MKLKIFTAVSVIIIVAFLVYSQTARRSFAPAEDFPREAVLYVQVADLPALIKLWNESKFKEKYLAGANFEDFSNNHLGRKLASRRQEFSDAAGFPIDLETLGKLTGNQAAFALYDIGKLEFVFIAPVSDEIFAATKFARNREKFTGETFDDDTVIYRAAVEADRGRQKQELIFTQLKGRFILATSEKLLVQTLNNINGKTAKNRLVDEPSFKILSEKIEPHSATVWLDQTALNDDYYFKHYWLMSDMKDLKNIRAGIFDFEMREGKFVERRKFLLKEAVKSSAVEKTEAAKLLSFAPDDIPFYRLRAANLETIGDTIEKTIFARRQETEKTSRKHSARYSFDDDDYYSNDYESLGEKYDETIDQTDDEETTERQIIEVDFSKLLQAANPRAVLNFTQPKTLPAPMFIEFQSAMLVYLAAPQSFNREIFESAIARKLAARTMIAAPGVKLNWETKSDGDFSRRELNLPMLGWNVSYALRGKVLILTNDADFLREIFNISNATEIDRQSSSFDSLTVINFREKANAYEKVFNKLNEQKMADEFFTSNVESLLDSISDVEKIEIKETFSGNFFDEEILINFK